MSGIDTKKRLVRSRSGLRVVSLDQERTSPFELTEPFWVPDDESPSCSKCQTKFDFLTRRHHCRRCGNVFCSHCCEQKMPLPRMCFVDPVRICGVCSEITKKENEFYDKHLKVLLSGANFFLNDATEVESEVSFLCCLSPDHQAIVFDGGDTWKHNPLYLSQIISVKILGTSGSPGSTLITGTIIRYLDPLKDERELHLNVANVPSRKQSASWISALQRAIKLVTPGPHSP